MLITILLPILMIRILPAGAHRLSALHRGQRAPGQLCDSREWAAEAAEARRGRRGQGRGPGRGWWQARGHSQGQAAADAVDVVETSGDVLTRVSPANSCLRGTDNAVPL